MTQTLDINKPININFNPSKKQTKAWELLNDKDTLFVGYGGAAFSGKTHLLCNWITIMCIGYPETSWGLGRKELVTLKKTTLVTLFKIFNEYNIIIDRDYKYNQQLNTIEFYNKSVIYLIDTATKPSDPLFTRFGGLELTGCGIDESAETDYKAIEILFTRLGRRNNDRYGLQKKLLETFNPSKTHIYRRYYLPHKDKKELDHTKFIPALPSDNPSPEVPEYIKGIIKTADNVTIERLIYGNFEYDDNPNALFEYNDILNIFSNEFVKGIDKYLTCDIAYEGSDLFVIGYWEGFECKKIWAIDKIDPVLVSKKIHEIRIERKVPISNVVIDADGLKVFVRQSTKTGYLEGVKEFYNGSKAKKVEGRQENFKNLKAQCYFWLAEKVRKNEIYISDKEYRKQIIEELEQICKLPMADDIKIALEKKSDLKERLGRSPDFADMLMMRMYFELHKEVISVTTESLSDMGISY